MNIKLLPKDFDWNNYLLLNTDLTFTKEEDCKNHYFNHGINEDRKYILDIPDDFDWKIYLEINPDLAINCSDKYLIIVLNIYVNNKYVPAIRVEMELKIQSDTNK